MGCYRENIRQRHFNVSPGSYQPELMRSNYCRERCGTFDYSYAAVADGKFCFCSQTMPGSAAVNDTLCDVQCAGMSTEYCGSRNYVGVYDVIKTITGLQVSSNIVGQQGTPASVTLSISLDRGNSLHFMADYDDNAGFTNFNETEFQSRVVYLPGTYQVQVAATDDTHLLQPVYAATGFQLDQPVNDVEIKCDEYFATHEIGKCEVVIWRGTDLEVEVNVTDRSEFDIYLENVAGQDSNYDNTGQDSNYDNTGQDSNYDNTGQDSNYDNTEQDSNYDNTGQDSNYDNTGQDSNYDNTEQDNPVVSSVGSWMSSSSTGITPGYFLIKSAQFSAYGKVYGWRMTVKTQGTFIILILAPGCGSQTYCYETNRCQASCSTSTLTMSTTCSVYNAFCSQNSLCYSNCSTAASRYRSGLPVSSYIVKWSASVNYSTPGTYWYDVNWPYPDVEPGYITGLYHNANGRVAEISGAEPDFLSTATSAANGTTISTGTDYNYTHALQAFYTTGSKVDIKMEFLKSPGVFPINVTARNKKLLYTANATTNINLLEGVDIAIIIGPEYITTHKASNFTLAPHTGITIATLYVTSGQ
ncbi:hypothetical protein Btru_076715 [Bulinus truncatus]|nr:hypothetical protein Btru_076715 [Bulinus truncatus]